MSTTSNLVSRRSVEVEHDGESLYVEVLGEGGVPLILSHGLGGNHAVWLYQAAHFAVDRQVVLWDHRGFGRSTNRAERSGPEVAAGDLLAICDHLDISTADLVGQSMGGWTVAGAALARPALPRLIVLADSLAGFASDDITTGMSTSGPVLDDGPGRIGIHPAIDPSLVERDPARALLYQQLGGMGTIDPAQMVPRILSVSHDADEAAQISGPVLCLVGERDPLFPPASIRALATLFPNGSFAEIKGSGHSPYFEDPEAWNTAVGDFFGAHG